MISPRAACSHSMPPTNTIPTPIRTARRIFPRPSPTARSTMRPPGAVLFPAPTACLPSSKRVLAKEEALVRQELRALLGHRPKTLRFVDRTFNIRPERTLAIWRFLLEQPGDTVFHFEMAPDRFTAEMFSFLQTVPAGPFSLRDRPPVHQSAHLAGDQSRHGPGSRPCQYQQDWRHWTAFICMSI